MKTTIIQRKKMTKNRSVMGLALPALLACLLLLPQHPRCQPAFNFVSVPLDTVSPASHTVIRTVDGTTAVVSANRRHAATLFRVRQTSLSIQIDSASLGPGSSVYDMRVVGEILYFCGSYLGKGCIGRIRLDQFTAPPIEVQYSYLDPDPNIRSVLHRLAAYDNGASNKVVAVGECFYRQQYASPDFPPCGIPPSSPSSECARRVVVEADDDGSGTFSQKKFILSDTVGRNDCIWEPIASDNFLALVGYNGNRNAISLHRCDKHDVLNSYGLNWSLYPVGTNEGASKFRGCRMEDDLIAVASLNPDTPGGLDLSSSVLRVFELHSIENVVSQQILTNLKDEPKELVFLPDDQTLVLLQNLFLPGPGSTEFAFVELKPHHTDDYSPECWFQLPDAAHRSLDRISPTQYVATDGRRLCLKTASAFNVPNSCYDRWKVTVQIIGNAPQDRQPPIWPKKHYWFVDTTLHRPAYQSVLSHNCLIP